MIFLLAIDSGYIGRSTYPGCIEHLPAILVELILIGIAIFFLVHLLLQQPVVFKVEGEQSFIRTLLRADQGKVFRNRLLITILSGEKPISRGYLAWYSRKVSKRKTKKSHCP